MNNVVSRANSDFVHFLDLDTFSSVRRPKYSGVIWKQKWSSNTSNVDLSYVSHLKLNKDVKRYSRKDLLSCNNSHLGETSSAHVYNDAMHVSCNSRMCDLFDENNLFIFDDESVRISPISKMPFRKKPRDSMNICLWIIDSGCSKHMTGNCALLTNFMKKFLGMVRFGNNDFAVIAGYGDVTSNALHNAIMEAGGKDRPPMLAPDKDVPVTEGSSETTTKRYMKNDRLLHGGVVDGGEGITHWLKGLGVTCEHLGANGRKKRYLATVIQICEGDKRFGGFGRVSPWGWEGLTLKEFGKFTSRDSESLESYYSRFYKMMNELVRNQCDVTNHQVNVQFLLQLQPEWQRFVTLDDEMSKDKEIDKLMALISLSFKKIYKPTNNNLQTSSNTSIANQDNSLRINRGTGYDNQRIGNVVEAKEKVGIPVVQKSGIQCYNCKEYGHVAREYQKPKRAKDAAYHKEKMLLYQELEAHYMYMAQIQEVTPDAADNYGPIFNFEPLQKVPNNDNYNVFAIESEHPKQSKSVNDTYPFEKDEHNVIIDSLDMSYDRERVDQDDDNDLANERDLLASLIEKLKCEINDSKNRNKFLETSNKALVDKLKEMKKELFVYQETIFIMSQQKEAQIEFYKTREDKEIDKVIALENKVKVLDNIVYKIGQSVQTMNMLNPPESDEVIRLEKESRSKLSDLIRPFDYEKLNNLYDLFVPQREKSYAQRYFSKSRWGKNNNPSITISSRPFQAVAILNHLPDIQIIICDPVFHLHRPDLILILL
uniref:Integrase, catalytic region, zinc finger, CCHC-type, peptidase aspartic, catalytic n=1 Tax=Tanacetum cinerariifolium TaxID=118510 RepID=A0A6L2NHU9_TANCI|nr:integrase, catalytic region, zinc finger, CCHC-type, peptidase aspartic, catalytic [Tanacetum cinerariifolium]